MKLHYSQTPRFHILIIQRFDSPMKLHYSQTFVFRIKHSDGLIPLWNYTTLKRLVASGCCWCVWFPYEITLLSNIVIEIVLAIWFDSPMKLHYSQTGKTPSTLLRGLIPLWNYTTLKPYVEETLYRKSLIPLWNYTTLKRDSGNRYLW